MYRLLMHRSNTSESPDRLLRCSLSLFRRRDSGSQNGVVLAFRKTANYCD